MLKNAKQEALARLRKNNRLNSSGGCLETAYSPTTGAVGCRWQDGDEIFRIWNIHYPMYGRSDEVKDWISVGIATPKIVQTKQSGRKC